MGRHLIRALTLTGREVFAGSLTADPGRSRVPDDAERLAVQQLVLDVRSDASVEAAVRVAAPDEVYHLAAQSSVGSSFSDPVGTWEVNAMGTLRLLHILQRRGPGRTRVLLVSSAEVYGAVPEAEQPICETRPLSPASPYAASKAAAEMAVLQAAVAGGVSAVIARSFNHTGPGQDTRFALAAFAAQLREVGAGAREPVLRVGNLQVQRDFLDVRDVVRAYLTLMEKGADRTAYNVASGEAISLESLVRQLVRLSGGEARVEVDPERFRSVDIPLLCGNPARLRALGWNPAIPMKETLRDLLAAEQP